MTVQLSSKVYPTPLTVIIQGYVIETYPSMSEVPYAIVRDRRTKPPPKPTLDPSRRVPQPYYNTTDLHNRCRLCLSHKSGSPVLVCGDCHHAFHLACVAPRLRDVLRGGGGNGGATDWRCAGCVRLTRHRAHVRATEVVALRRVLKEVEERPLLPPKLRLKLLDVPPLTVETCSAGGGETLWQGEDLEEVQRGNIGDGERGLPPKRRIGKKRRYDPSGHETEGQPDEGVARLKWIDGESLERRKRYIGKVADELSEAARRLNETAMVGRLARVEESLAAQCDLSGTYIQR